MEMSWLSLYVENEVGVLAKIAGLFSGKCYNLHSLTVGETEDVTISRMTLCVEGDDNTFEQIKKQLNCMVEVIKVIDLSGKSLHKKEVLYIKVKSLKDSDKAEIMRIAQVYDVKIADYGKDSILLECLQTENQNNNLINLITKSYHNVEVVRGGSVAIESISMK